ncbi:MAG: hypothetical protein IPO30_20555 [Hyphomonadaceae bacterium]|nr:hypothetical protein [Hyphomonadaceae bacterium]
MMPALRRAMPRVQFIVTTHDPLCLRGMSDGEVAVLNRDENQKIGQLLDLPGVTGLRAEQLLTSDYFGLNSTAEPDVEIDLARLADSLTGVNPTAKGSALSQQLNKTIVTGDSAAEQLMSEAVLEYLNSRRRSPIEVRAVKRIKTVSALVEALAARVEDNGST